MFLNCAKSGLREPLASSDLGGDIFMRTYLRAAGSILVAAILALGAAAATAPASAADMAPVYKAAPAAVVSPSGYYVWVDGMYDRVRLPSYALGLHNVITVGTFPDAGLVQSFDPSLNGGGVRGAIGYILPGSTWRFELGGSYIGANGTNSAVATASTIGGANVQLLDGTLPATTAFVCNGATTCTTASTLSTSYTAWQFNGKAAADWKFGSILVTPSVAIFGGNARTGQSLTQTLTQSNFPGSHLNYTASTTLRWTDAGVRAGLDTSIPLTPAFSIGLGGWVGVAQRHTSLSGNDASTASSLNFIGASTLSTSANKGVFLANLEAGLAYKMTTAVTLRGFAGLDYDASVPGISSPAFVTVVPAANRTPAGISYSHESSFYAGGGVVVRFGN
jgi:hypothetical protein